MRRERRQLQAVIGQQKFLIARVLKPRETPLQHDRRHDRHLVEVVRSLAKLRAAAIFLDADDASRAADGKAKRRQAFDLLWCKTLFDIPHRALSLVNAVTSVKRTARPADGAAIKPQAWQEAERAGTPQMSLPVSYSIRHFQCRDTTGASDLNWSY